MFIKRSESYNNRCQAWEMWLPNKTIHTKLLAWVQSEEKVRENIIPDTEESKTFLSEIWDQKVKQNENAEEPEHVHTEI